MAAKKRYSVAVTMRLESLSSSIQENESSMAKDAVRMLEDEEYVNFFMSCGPNYVRSIQRAQEVTSIISYEAIDDYTAQRFADALKLYVYGNRGDSMRERSRSQRIPMDFTGFNLDLDFDYSDIRKSLSIEILGFGLGLNSDGSSTLVATSLDEFNQVMRFAFDSMTKNESMGRGTGMIYGMEVIPWTDNAEFLKFANVDYNTILAPVPRALIENAMGVKNQKGFVDRYVCTSINSEPDDFGKCCDPLDVVDMTKINEFGSTTVKSSCQPEHYLTPVVMKDNLETNAEFVSWLGFVAREKVKSLTTLSQCVNKLRSFPKRFEYHFMKTSKKGIYDKSLETAYTLKELKSTFDPLGDLSILSLIGNENDEFFEMFYQPCLSALYGMNNGNDKTTDPKYFMSEPWYNHKECARPSCLESDMAWDRKNGNGCVEGVLGRRKFKLTIPASDDPHCAKTIDPTTGQEICKFIPSVDLMYAIDNCRERSIPGIDGRGKSVPFSLSSLMDYFCMPQLDVERGQAIGVKMDEADFRHQNCVSH